MSTKSKNRILQNLKKDDQEQDVNKNEFNLYTRIEKEETIRTHKFGQTEEELSETSDEEGIASKKDIERIDFSPALGVSISKKVHFKEDINLFNTDTPVTTGEDFSQDFSIDCPISKILKELKNIKERKSSKRPISRDPIQEAIYASEWWKHGFITKKYCWSKLEHRGVSIQQYTPHGIPLRYGDKEIPLTADQEEFVNAVAPVWEIESKTHKESWLQLFHEYYGQTEMTDISKINMNRIYVHLIQQSLKQTKSGPQYAIVDHSVVPVDMGEFSSKMVFRKHSTEYYSRVIPENITIAADLTSPVPPCSLDGHNWEQLNFSPTNAHSAFATIFQKTRLPFSSASKSYQDYENYTTIRNLASTLLHMHQYVNNYLQHEKLETREKATLLWLQLYYFLDMTSKPRVVDLKVKNIHFKTIQSIEIKLSSTLVFAIKETQFPQAALVLKNLVDFCRGKKEDERVFTTTITLYNQLMASYFPSFTMSHYLSFIASVHLQKFLMEPIPPSLTTEQKKLLLESTKYYIIEKLSSRKMDKKHSVYAMAEEYVLVTKQLHDLKKMLKKVKKGESVPLISQKKKRVMEEVIEYPDEASLKTTYEQLIKKKRKMPNYEEWKKKEVEKIEEKRKKQKEVKNKCAILFEDSPSVEEVKERVKEFKKKLDRMDSEIRGYSSDGRVSVDFDPRIIVAWCKRVDCPVEAVLNVSSNKWAVETTGDFVYLHVYCNKQIHKQTIIRVEQEPRSVEHQHQS